MPHEARSGDSGLIGTGRATVTKVETGAMPSR
jgi:hypothetical protein